MTQHTPGPWELDEDTLVVTCPQYHIADVFSAEQHGMANARLIAAAPEMLDNITDTEAELAGILADPAGIPEPIVELIAKLANRQAILLVRIEGKE